VTRGRWAAHVPQLTASPRRHLDGIHQRRPEAARLEGVQAGDRGPAGRRDHVLQPARVLLCLHEQLRGAEDRLRGQLLGMMAFGVIADRHGRRAAFTGYSLLTAAAIYGLAFHWHALLAQPVRFWAVLFAMGLGSGCTAGFGALLAELFPTDVRNFAMGTTYNCARGVQLFAPVLVGFFVARHGLAGGLGVPMVLAVLTAAWVWTLPETRTRDLAAIAAPR